MAFIICRSCRKLMTVESAPADALCADCRRNAGHSGTEIPLPSTSVPTTEASFARPTAAPTPSVRGAGRALSPYLAVALVLLLAAVGILAANAQAMSRGFSWLTAVALLLILLALGFAAMGVADASDRDKRQRQQSVQIPSPVVVPVTGDLSHRWGWKVFRAVAALCFVCIMIASVGLLGSGLPVWVWLSVVGGLMVVFAVVNLILYGAVVLPRVSYFLLARRGRAKSLPDTGAAPVDSPPLSSALAPNDAVMPSPDRLTE